MVINAPSSLLMFQFEDVMWDYMLGAEREMVWKEKQESCPLGTALTPSQQTKSHIASQMRRLTLKTRGAALLMLLLLDPLATKRSGVPQSTEYGLCNALAWSAKVG